MIWNENSDNIDLRMIQSLETLLEEKRTRMKKKEILSRYSIKQLPLPDGRWWIRIDGKQYFRKTREELENLILELNKPSEITICEIFDAYLEQRKMRVATTTWAIDKKYFDTYISGSALGNKPIRDLNIEDGYEFFEYVKTIKPDIKEKYWKNLKSCLDMIIKYSIQKRYIDYHPFEYLQLHISQFAPKTETLDEDTVFSKSEQSKVCSIAIKDAQDSYSSIPLGIVLLFHTGLRIGELIASKWCDIIDVDGKPNLYIRRIQIGSVDEEGNIRGREIADRCKSKRSKRKVPLNSECLRLLELIKDYNEECGYPVGENDYLFYREVGGYVTECTERCFSGRLKKYCKEAGMSVIKSPHDVRRTALTNLWLSGVPIKIIQLIAGHNSQKQTEDYIRISDKDLAKYDYTEVLVDSAKGFDVQSNGQCKVVQFRKRA